MSLSFPSVSRREWLLFAICACAGFALWWGLTFPQLSFINLSVDRAAAIHKAEIFFNQHGYRLKGYRRAAVFAGESGADRYLQKALGYNEEIAFLKEHNFDLFFWKVRFFKEKEKEQFDAFVSADTGEVIGFRHTIRETDARPFVTKEEAREVAEAFLREQGHFHPDRYLVHSDQSRKLDHRTEYTFTWEKKGVAIPWKKTADGGVAKLLMGVKVSGHEVLSYSRLRLKIPDEFHREMARLNQVGKNINHLLRFFYFILLAAAVFYVLVRRNSLIMHSVKNFALSVTGVLFLCHFLSYLNEWESVVYRYPTTISWAAYLWQNLSGLLMQIFIVTISILMPLLAGEVLHYETLRKNRAGAFLPFLQTSFRQKTVAETIGLGYLAAVALLGLQAAIFLFGQKFCGVWTERPWLAQLSASRWPFLTALIIGLNASLAEEINFRLFCLSFFKKVFRRLGLAVLFSSLLWGFGHSGYSIYPMWFRGFEVTLMGFIYAALYLRYGLICVLTAHFVFDVFWVSCVYLFGEAAPPDTFFGSLIVLGLPFLWAVFCVFRPSKAPEKPLRWRLRKTQIANKEILTTYFQSRPSVLADPSLKENLLKQGWDLPVVELALEEVKEENDEKNRDEGEAADKSSVPEDV